MSNLEQIRQTLKEFDQGGATEEIKEQYVDRLAQHGTSNLKIAKADIEFDLEWARFLAACLSVPLPNVFRNISR